MKSHLGQSFRRNLQRRARMLFLTAAMLCTAVSAHAQDDVVNPPAGGPGGSAFVARCPQREYLTGLDLRGGALVDAIRPICSVAYGPAEPGPLEPAQKMIGGPGGSPRQLLCPRGFPFVKTLMFTWKTKDPSVIQSLQLVCGTASIGKEEEQFDEGAGPSFFGSDYSTYVDPDNPAEAAGSQGCGDPADDFHAASVGITGRTGEWLDALGIICNLDVEYTPKPVALGRAEASNAPPLKTMGGEAPICARARDARARNSPVAPRLEAACRADGGNFVDRTVARVPDSSTRNAEAESQVGTVAPAPAGRYSNLRVKPGSGMQGGASRVPDFSPSSTVPTTAPGHAFVPPVFVDGAQLWACFDGAHAEANGAACQGLDAGVAFCRQQGLADVVRTGADGTPDLQLASARPGIPVRAINGDACTTNDCAVVSELHCAP